MLMEMKLIIVLNAKTLKAIIIYMLKLMFHYQVMYLLVIEKKPYDSFGIDPLYCISAPTFSNKAMLKMTNAKIELITDLDIYLIIKKGIRGGRCEPSYYHAKANNKPNFNKNKDEEPYIISLDANSLYFTAMCYKFPYEQPKFDNDIKKYTVDFIFNLDLNGD